MSDPTADLTGLLRSSVSNVTKALREDEGYYISWKANIAMAFYDAAVNDGLLLYTDIPKARMHEVANKAADNFLELLMTPTGD